MIPSTANELVEWGHDHLYGPINSVGSRPGRVVNFFQTSNTVSFQNGGPIQEADREFDLTSCFSHNGLARSTFVHDTIYNEVRQIVGLGQRSDPAKNRE